MNEAGCLVVPDADAEPRMGNRKLCEKSKDDLGEVGDALGLVSCS